MQRFTFGSFIADEANSEALRLCEDIAELRTALPSPLVLVGEEGCGKTHLLCAVVNRVRSCSPKAGLAYVTAYDFPDQVRALIDDPSPVERSPSAILLVDQLEEFGDLAVELETVVQLFLDHHHTVVMASRLHPERLHNLTSGLRHLIESGQTVLMRTASPAHRLDVLKQQLRAEDEEQIRQRDEEISRLQARLTEVLETHQGEAGREAQLARENAQLREELAVARREGEQAREEAHRLLQRAEHLVAQIEAGRGALSTSSETPWGEAEEASAQELARMTAERDSLRASLESLQGAARKDALALRQARAEIDSLREAARVAQQECAAAQASLQEMARAREDLQVQLEESRRQMETQLEIMQAEADAKIRAYQSALEQTREALEQEIAGRLRDPESVQAEAAALRASLQEADAEKRRLIAQLQSLQERLASQRSEMDMLRHEAAGQVAAAHTEAGELAGRLARLQTSFEHACLAGRDAGAQLRALCQDIATAVDAIAQFAERFMSLPGPSGPAEVFHDTAFSGALENVFDVEQTDRADIRVRERVDVTSQESGL